jgi:ribosomal protein L37E
MKLWYVSDTCIAAAHMMKMSISDYKPRSAQFWYDTILIERSAQATLHDGTLTRIHPKITWSNVGFLNKNVPFRRVHPVSVNKWKSSSRSFFQILFPRMTLVAVTIVTGQVMMNLRIIHLRDRSKYGRSADQSLQTEICSAFGWQRSDRIARQRWHEGTLTRYQFKRLNRS